MKENEIYLTQLEPDDDCYYICYRPQKGLIKTTEPTTIRFLDYQFKTRPQTDYMYCKVPKEVMHSFLLAFDAQVFDDGKHISEVFPVTKKRKAMQAEHTERWRKK